MKAHPTVSELEHAAEMNPNLDVIAGLRDVADWLEDHPELPQAWFTAVNFDTWRKENPRQILRQLADALGDETRESSDVAGVTIERQFTGRVKVTARANINSLRDAPPVLEYEPIIQPPEPVTVPVDAEDFDV